MTERASLLIHQKKRVLEQFCGKLGLHVPFLFLKSDLRRRAAAFPWDEPVRHDDLGCQKIRVLDVVDGLAGRFHAQLVGVHVHGGQLRAGDAGEQGVIEGNDGKVFRDVQPQLAAELLQHHGRAFSVSS